MPNSEILEELIQSPSAFKIIEAAQAIFEKEKIEREKFYEIRQEEFNAEFINGEIRFHPPIRLNHFVILNKLADLLKHFVRAKKLGIVGVENTIIHLTRNNYKPSICFFKQERAKQFTSDQMLFPAPDFVIEILSDSTEKIDRGIKFIDYAAHGVTEYWIVDPTKKTVEKYLLQQGEYYLDVKLSTEGRLRSISVEGFEIDLKELFT